MEYESYDIFYTVMLFVDDAKGLGFSLHNVLVSQQDIIPKARTLLDPTNDSQKTLMRRLLGFCQVIEDHASLNYMSHGSCALLVRATIYALIRHLYKPAGLELPPFPTQKKLKSKEERALLEAQKALKQKKGKGPLPTLKQEKEEPLDLGREEEDIVVKDETAATAQLSQNEASYQHFFGALRQKEKETRKASKKAPVIDLCESEDKNSDSTTSSSDEDKGDGTGVEARKAGFKRGHMPAIALKEKKSRLEKELQTVRKKMKMSKLCISQRYFPNIVFSIA